MLMKVLKLVEDLFDKISKLENKNVVCISSILSEPKIKLIKRPSHRLANVKKIQDRKSRKNRNKKSK